MRKQDELDEWKWYLQRQSDFLLREESKKAQGLLETVVREIQGLKSLAAEVQLEKEVCTVNPNIWPQ